MAIVVTPKLANLPDVSVAGATDGQVLTYDDATATWIAETTAAGVTDHGALTGLGDDDHTQYLLKAGGTMTGAVKIANGALGAPSISFSSNDKVGIYYISNGMGFSFGSSGTFSAEMNSAAWSQTVPLRLADGSISSPSYSFSSSSNSGMYYSGGLRFVAGGIDRLFMKNSGAGFVGIGTTDPGAKLDVQYDTSFTTNSVVTLARVTHNTSLTPTAGFGAGILFQLQSSTTASQDAAQIAASWSDATHATRKSQLDFYTSYNGTLRSLLTVTDQSVTLRGGSGLQNAFSITGAGIGWNGKFYTTYGTSSSLLGLSIGNDPDTGIYRQYVNTSGGWHFTSDGTDVFYFNQDGIKLESGQLNFANTMGNSTKVPGTDAPADWVQIEIGGTTYYLPAYAA